MPISQLISIPEKPGQIVNLSKKLETKLIAVHVGLSVLLKLCLIESVLLPTKLYKPESLQMIYFLAVDFSPVVWDAMEVILQVLGDTGLMMVLLLEIYTEITAGVNLTLFHPVTIMLMVLMDLVKVICTHLNVLKHAYLDTKLLTKMTDTTVLAIIQSDPLFLIFKQKS